MPNFIDDFFENREWLRIPQHNSSTGKLQVAGTNIYPYEFTKTAFGNLTSSDYAGVEVRVTDVHSTSAGVGGVRFIGGSSWVLTESQVYYSTYAAGVAAFPAATYPGLRMYAADLGFQLTSNGTRYLPSAGQAYIFNEVNGTLGSPTKSLGDNGGTLPQLFTLSKPNLPGGLVQAGDMLLYNFDAQRHGTGNMTLVLSLGTSAAVLTDAVLWSLAITTTDLAKIAGVIKVLVGSNTSASTNSTSGIQQTGGSGSGTRASVTANLNFAANQVLKMGLSFKATNAEALDLMQLSCLWVPAS